MASFDEPVPEPPLSSEPDHPTGDDDTSTKILRRTPLNTGSRPDDAASEPATSILRRQPTGALPVASDPATQVVDASAVRQLAERATPTAVGPPRAPQVDARAAIATAVMSILSGWASGVIATDLITGWWATDLLFCIAVGFLAAVSAAASISGVVALLLRRRTARLLVVVGAVIALLIFASLFVAGASLPAVVFALPLLPLASIVLAALPATARWSRTT